MFYRYYKYKHVIMIITIISLSGVGVWGSYSVGEVTLRGLGALLHEELKPLA